MEGEILLAALSAPAVEASHGCSAISKGGQLIRTMFFWRKAITGAVAGVAGQPVPLINLAFCQLDR